LATISAITAAICAFAPASFGSARCAERLKGACRL
jgi:hypothetical protein